MRAEELDNLTEQQLQQKANECFVKAEETNVHLADGGFEKLRLQLEAQFYLTALARKRDDAVAQRDFRMEVGVIILIGLEIILSVIFGVGGVLEGKDQARILKEMDTSTAATATSMTAVSTSMNSLAAAQTESLARLDLPPEI